MSSPRLRLLLVLQYPGYLRYFDSVIDELSRRGHTVLIAFDRLQKQREGLIGLDDTDDRVKRVDAIPDRGDPYSVVARELRTTVDYLRYKHPDFRQSPYLRGRMLEALTGPLRLLGWLPSLPPWLLDKLISSLLYLERRVPTAAAIRSAIDNHDVDVVLVSPLVTKGSSQVDVVKAARSLGLPCGLGVASWDHLTTKGLVRSAPDRLFVWNELQRAEAIKYHAIEAGRVTITGAQNFDRWFHRLPSSTVEEFHAKIGLIGSEPYVLFVGSTASISAPEAEVEWVRNWLGRMRDASDTLRNAPVLIRPHPYNLGLWDQVDLSEFGNVTVYPRSKTNPVASQDREEYFDSIYHSAAVVGINTSAMIEAAILEKAVHTIRTEDFSRTQEGTLHFHYMLPENGGFLQVAGNLDEHFAQLERNLTDPEPTREVTRNFVRHFLRPLGLTRPSTPMFVTHLERLAKLDPAPTREPTPYHPVTAGLAIVGKLLNGLRGLRRRRRSKESPEASATS